MGDRLRQYISWFLYLACIITVNRSTATLVCPKGFVLHSDNLCYPKDKEPTLICPEDYQLNEVDKLCYRINPEPCPSDSTTSTPETTQASTPTQVPLTTQAPPTVAPLVTVPPTITQAPESLSRCPKGMILIGDQCRKIICTGGEYRNGRCLQPTCPEGTVWFNKRCQPPGYLITILDIENIIHNQHNYNIVTENTNNVNYHTPPPFNYTISEEDCSDKEDEFEESIDPKFTPVPTETTTQSPNSTTTTISTDNCCTIITPRLCKNYGHKWVCFNRRYRRCDSRVCTSPLIYLKPPGIRHAPPLLVMPPNPPLEACTTPQCDNNDLVDCSGCAHNQRDTCSPFCYQYRCPGGACQLINHQDYCELYPGEFGCTSSDGCLWDWCNEKC